MTRERKWSQISLNSFKKKAIAKKLKPEENIKQDVAENYEMFKRFKIIA